jgi:hypothetical protein
MRAVAPVIVLPAILVSCLVGCSTRDNPDTCSAADPVCDPGRKCVVERNLCLTPGEADAGTRADGRDGPAKIDGASDARADGPPDAPGTCATNDDCRQEGQRFCFENHCVACLSSDNCSNDRPFCSANKTCETCQVGLGAGNSTADAGADGPDAAGPDAAAADAGGSDAGGSEAGAWSCPESARHCDPSGACVECQSHGHCTDLARPACGDTKRCVACTMGQDEPCAARADTPVCGPAGACVACNKSADCKQPGAPICAGQVCVPCKTDRQCEERGGGDPGVCLIDQGGGGCATDAETIYVKNAAGCAMGAGGGSQAMPYCQPAQAMAAITPERRVVVLRGPGALGGLVISATGAPVTVVGQMGAEIVPGALKGIDVRAGDVYIRGVTVRDSEDTGVTVVGAATLRLSRCYIRRNKLGGMLVTGGAGFDVSNCVFEGNQAVVSGASVVGGGYFEAPAGDRPRLFRFNTVVGNMTTGVVCPATVIKIESSLLFNNGAQAQTNAVVCDASASTNKIGVDPQFATPFHLGPSSPCLNAGNATDFPPEDIDGDPRPQGPGSDCGADELRP